MRFRLFAVIVSFGYLAGVPASAHHAFSLEFDSAKAITLDVKQPDDAVVNWKCETRGPNGLERQGWKRDSLKPGDAVTVHGFQARYGSHMADGRKILSGAASY
jgi:hypothetical protein